MNGSGQLQPSISQEALQLPSPDTSPTSTTPSSTISSKSKMLTVDFSTPLVGAARAERIKQMSSTHEAFNEARNIQTMVYNIQTSLRRMPGVSGLEATEMANNLQTIARVTSRETAQLVDAIANLELDLEDSKRAHMRLSVKEKILAGQVDDKDQQLKRLDSELRSESEKREQAESEVKKIMEDLSKLSTEFKSLKEINGDSNGSEDRDRSIKKLEDTIKHLEDQVNNRRSLWVMKHSDPEAVARAIESLAGKEQTQEVTRKAIASLHRGDSSDEPSISGGSAVVKEQSEPTNGVSLLGWEESTGSPQASFANFHLPPRPGTAAPGNNGASMYRRPPSVVNSDRRLQAPWSQGRSTTYGQPPQPPPVSGFGRPQARRGYQPGSGRYRNAVSNFDNSGSYGYQDGQTISRPPSAFQYGGRDQPNLPTTPNRGNKYTRHNSNGSQWSASGNGSGGHNSLISHAPLGPLIHMTETSVNAWNEQIMEFYAVIRNFVEKHASMPDYSSLVQLGRTQLWPILLAMYHPLSENEATSYLDFHLKEESSKSCLVTRVIIDFVVNRVWVPAAWIGSDRETTFDLMRLGDDLEATAGQPSHMRQPLLDRQSTIIDRIMTHRDKDSEFYKSKVEDYTGMMMQSLNPMLNKLVNHTEAFADMRLVAESAWDLSSKILTSRLTFDFRFPEIGSRFSSQSMLPIWPAIDPIELQAKHWRVALVTTPVITCRNDTGTNISAHSVALADVVCMQ